MLSEGDEPNLDPRCRGQSWLRADPNPRLATHERHASESRPLSGDLRQGTYSIVARDPSSGELGVAVESHWFSVGSVVPWAAPGVGAVATQSIAEPAYGARLLDRVAAGEVVGDALEELLAGDEQARFRQVAAVDAGGGGAGICQRRRPAVETPVGLARGGRGGRRRCPRAPVGRPPRGSGGRRAV